MTTGLGARAPKYQRVANELRRDIQERTYAPGNRLPPETTLSERFRVSLPTIRQAVGVLRAEGLLESHHGIGTFVSANRRLQRRSRHRYGRARSDHKLLTSHLRHEIPFAGRAPAPTHIAEAMGIEPGTDVVTRRRHLFDKETGRPEEVGASHLPMQYAGGTFLEQPDVVPKALFLCMEDLSGMRYSKAHDQWLSRLPSAEETDVLELASGAPILHVVHTARGEDGTVLEVSESVWPASRVMIVDDYDITQEAAEPESPSEI